MIRMTCILLLFSTALGGLADAQGMPNEPSSTLMLERFLKTQASSLLAKRRAEVASLKTPHDIELRQQRLRMFFAQSLGDLPERTPLNPRIVGDRRYPSYRVERIIFESRPRHHVTALLYLPEGKPPFPGVLVPCGHTASGKAGDTYQQICILLTRCGMAAFCYDPIGQGERVQMVDENGKPSIREGSTTEHTMAGIGALLVGRQAATYRILDGIRALDYLASRPEIDPAHLGCTGNSGGGTMTAYLMALDDRIAAAAPSCYITSLDRLFATIGPQDAEQNITGQVAAGLDHGDYVILRAPKPTLLTVGTQDFFDIQGSWDTFREVKLIYGRMGFGERVDLFESDEPHGFTSPRRVATARWMRRWLLGKDDAITEPDLPIASESDLRCTRTGQVLTDLHGVSVFDLNREREQELRPDRSRFCKAATTIQVRSKIRELLGLGRGTRSPHAIRVLEETAGRFCRSRKLTVSPEPGIVLEAEELIPEWPDSRAPIVVKLGSDRDSELAPGGPVERLVRQGRRIVFADLRGMRGYSSRDRSSRRESLLGHEVQAAFLSLHIGRPLLGQRVLDLLCLLEDLKSGSGDQDFPGFEVMATGPSGLAALHAAALDEHNLIRRVSLARCLVSWTDVVRRGLCRDQLASVVPGVLGYYDLPELLARLDPLPVERQSPVDALGQPVAESGATSAASK
jgi:dienelactone hydrolase